MLGPGSQLADIFWNVQPVLPNPPPLTEHDFRLAPQVGTAPGAVTMVNPLMDVGLTPTVPEPVHSQEVTTSS